MPLELETLLNFLVSNLLDLQTLEMITCSFYTIFDRHFQIRAPITKMNYSVIKANSLQYQSITKCR